MDKFCAFVLFILFAITSMAQASLTCQLEHDTIGIGESVTVKLTATSLPNEDSIHNIQWSLNDIKNEFYSMDTTLLDEYADVQITDAGKFSTYLKDGLFLIPKEGIVFVNHQWSAQFKLSFFSPGKFVLPAPSIYGNTHLSGIDYKSSTLIVTMPKGMERDSLLEISENKDVIEIPRSPWEYLWKGVGILAVALALFLAYRYFQRRKPRLLPEEQKEKPVVVPYDKEALIRLNQLNQKQLWQGGLIKEYQTELTFIIRDYIGKRFGFDALEMTSAEIMDHSTIKDWPFDLHQKLHSLLTISDIVKFAKGSTSEDMYTAFMENAIEIVNQTRSDNPR